MIFFSGIFASLDKIETFQNTSSSTSSDTGTPTNDTDNPIITKKSTKGQKVVKNFNEFLNFASINKSRISDRLTNNKNLEEKINPQIKLTKSSFDDSDSSSLNDNNTTTANNIVNNDICCSSTSSDNKKPPLQLQLNNIMVEKQGSFDGSSPDDSQEYFPMTTSMTRELRLELENLDRHVFGTDFHQRTQFSALSGCETPESGDSIDKIPEFLYKKLNQNSIDFFENDSDYGGGGGNNGGASAMSSGNNQVNTIGIIHSTENDCSSDICSYPVMNGDVRSRIKSANYDENMAFKRISTSSANNDVFIWENPLHQFSASPQTIEVEIETIKLKSLTTPDEQCDLDYDGEIIEENNLGKKSVTPIRLLRKNGESGNNSNRNSILNDIDSDNSDSWNETNKVLSHENTIVAAAIQQIPLVPLTFNPMTNSCEEASEAQNIANELNNRASGILPSPHDFGCGNPFLMFLCLTLLLQHRDFVMKSGMDYNEMAMHFDKMVRKHNVTRVLNQARRMYAEYLKSQKNNNENVEKLRSSSITGTNVTASGSGGGGAGSSSNDVST